MQNINYQKELEKCIQTLDTHHKKLLIHSCCAPCSSYVLEYLRQYFDITVLYYNPNITEPEEYTKRVAEQKRLIDMMNVYKSDGMEETSEMPDSMTDALGGQTYGTADIQFIEGTYEPDAFFRIAKGLEQCPEGGERCFRCYELRLREAAEIAKAGGFDYFTTTLTISPLKNAAKLNEIGSRIGEEQGIAFLPSDFKKKNGYKRSVELSEQYDLYRQDYCGCIYSKVQRDKEKCIDIVAKE